MNVRYAEIAGAGLPYRGMKDCFGFICVRQGWVETRTASDSFERAYAGAGMLIRPGEVYFERARSNDAVLELVMLAGDDFDPCASHRGGNVRLPSGHPHAQAVSLLVASVRREGCDRALIAKLVGLIDEICSLLPERRQLPVRERAAVSEAQALMLNHYHEALRLDALAAAVRLSKFKLVRAFRERYGVPPYEYLMHVRIARARSLLRGGVRPADVATDIGYCDQSQLNRHFVRIVGTTPGRYSR